MKHAGIISAEFLREYLHATHPEPVARELERLAKGSPGPWLVPDQGRHQLPDLAYAAGLRRVCEVGVWRGAFSEAFLRYSTRIELVAVDPWAAHRGWLDTKNALPEAEARLLLEDAYTRTTSRLSPYGARVEIRRAFSVHAAATFPDGYFDLVYIDGDHSEAAVAADLRAWWPKVRRGGFIAGHDYRSNPDKPTIQVIPAVDAFVLEHQIRPWFLLAADRTPSFLWVKP